LSASKGQSPGDSGATQGQEISKGPPVETPKKKLSVIFQDKGGSGGEESGLKKRKKKTQQWDNGRRGDGAG